MLVPVLFFVSIALCLIPFLRPQLFRKEDVVLIVAFIIAGSNLWSKGRSIGELPQLSLILLTITAIFYTLEFLRLRNKHSR